MIYRAIILCVVLMAARGLVAAEAKALEYAAVHAILAKNCLACHDAKEAEGGLVMESHEGLMKGGDSGIAIVPGKSAESLLVKLIKHSEKPFMPPPKKAPKLSDADISVIAAWIDAGAKKGDPGTPLAVKVNLPDVKPKGAVKPSVFNVAYAPTKKLVAVARHGVVELLDAPTRAPIKKLEGHQGNVNDLAFSNDGMVLVAGSGDPAVKGVVHVWNTADATLIRKIEGHKDAVYAVAISPDGSTLASGSYDQRIILWDLKTGAEKKVLEGHNGSISDLAFRPDGKVLASASADRTVKLWDASSGARLDTLSESLKELNSVAWSPDGKRVAAAGVDNRIRVWQISDGAKEGSNQLLHAQFAHEGSILRIAFTADGNAIVSAADDKRVRLWDANSFAQKKVYGEQSDWPAGVAFVLGDKQLVIGRLDGSVAFMETESGNVLPPAKPEITAYSPRAIERGKATRIKLTGKALVEPKGGRLSIPKSDVKVVETNGSDVWVEVTPAADAPVNSHDLVLTTALGETAAIKLFVSDMPPFEVIEDAKDEALKVALPAMLMGAFEKRGDVDRFAFEGKKGQVLVFDALARRMSSKASMTLQLIGSDGRPVGVDNHFHDGADALLVATLPADGTYTLKALDAEMGASEKEHFYRIHAGSFALVTGTHPMAIPPHRASTVQLHGYNLPPESAKVQVPAAAPGEAPLALDGTRFRSRRALSVMVGPDKALVEDVEAESGASLSKPQPIDAPAAVNGRLSAPGEADVYAFEAKKGERWIIETLAARRGLPTDTKIEVLHADGKPVERVLLRAVRDSYINFRGIDANNAGVRLKNWEEMELNEYVYFKGEVGRILRAPQGPDSDSILYMSAGKRRAYFDTTAVAHANEEPAYIVEPHEPGSSLPFNGLPVFTVHYVNDDDSTRQLGTDSRLHFVAPADGAYRVRVSDTRGFGGDQFTYRLTVRPAKPDYQVTLADLNLSIPAGTGRSFKVRADRMDGYDGAIRVDIGNMPAGFVITTPLIIEAGHQEATGTVFALPDAKTPAEMKVQVTCAATIDGSEVKKPAANSIPKLSVAPKPAVLVGLVPMPRESVASARPVTVPQSIPEFTIAPGQRISTLLYIERNGFKERISFDVENLPHGVIVSDIGLNGVMITEELSHRQVFIECAKWVPDQTRLAFARAREAGNPTSYPILLHVRRPVQAAGK